MKLQTLPQTVSSDLDWLQNVDPDKVYDILVEHAGADDSESSRFGFISAWNDERLYEWRFGGSLGFGGKLWREKKWISGEGHVPHLRVSCYPEDGNDTMTQITKVTNIELLKLLHEAGLRDWR